MTGSENPKRKLKKKKQAGIPPAIILIVAAIIIFGLMYGFTYFENQNPDWLRTAS